MQTSPSLENYLKVIYILEQQNMGVRNVLIAENMKCSKASVTVAVKELVKHEYVEKKDHGNLCLTPEGREIAKNVYDRYDFFLSFLLRVGVEQEIAQKEACLLEHILSDDSYMKVKKYILDGIK